MSKSNHQSIHKLVTVSLLIALNVVLSRFGSIQTLDFKIGFSFITVVIAARMFGPVASMLVNGVGDFIGAILFPKGAFIPPISLTAALFGLIFGLFIYKQLNMKTITLSVITTQVICSMLLNSYILYVYFGLDFKTLVLARVLQCCVMSLVQITFMHFCLDKVIALINRTRVVHA